VDTLLHALRVEQPGEVIAVQRAMPNRQQRRAVNVVPAPVLTGEIFAAGSHVS